MVGGQLRGPDNTVDYTALLPGVLSPLRMRSWSDA